MINCRPGSSARTSSTYLSALYSESGQHSSYSRLASDPGSQNQEEHRSSLLRWDLSTLPDGMDVVSTTVQLYRYGGGAAGPMPVALHRVTRGWVEGSGWDFWPDPGYVPDGATWTQAAPVTPWTTAGGDYDSTTDYGHGANGILDQMTLPAGLANGWISLDASEAVRAWVEDGTPNDGLLLRPLGGQYTYHYYTSSESGTASLRPRLIVELAAACPTDVDGDRRTSIVDV